MAGKTKSKNVQKEVKPEETKAPETGTTENSGESTQKASAKAEKKAYDYRYVKSDKVSETEARGFEVCKEDPFPDSKMKRDEGFVLMRREQNGK